MAYNGDFVILNQMPAAIATAHPQTTQAAADVLIAGGNAYDAALAAMLMSFVTEPLLSSPGGGGYLLASPRHSEAQLFDFFSNAPLHQPKPSETSALDHRPIWGNFGARQQEFHIGAAAMAIPGIAAGIHTTHQSLCTWALQDLAKPAITAARNGVIVNEQQAFVAKVLQPIIQATKPARQCYGDMQAGHVWKNPQLATFLDTLSNNSETWFYESELTDHILDTPGGVVTAADFKHQRCHIRQPLSTNLGPWQILTNPAPSTGGPLILSQLEHCNLSPEPVDLLGAMQFAAVQKQQSLSRGTTHISVVDNDGNLASMTLSNGEGNGHMAADWGFMLNNFLGEEDINPTGFFHWPAGTRLPSMMSPTILLSDDAQIALGSGGSNRIKSTLFLVINRIMTKNATLKQAIEQPRMHFENDHLDLEPGWPSTAASMLQSQVGQHHTWPDHNLYFGGVNGVQSGTVTEAVGDFRRQGSGVILS